MNYPITSSQHSSNMGESLQSSEELLVATLSEVIQRARAKGQTLPELQAEVLADDLFLDQSQRQHLSEVVAQAWEMLPERD